MASGALEQRTLILQYGVEMRALQTAFEEQRQQLDREHRDALNQLHLAHATRLEAAQQEGAIRMADASDQQAAAVVQLHTMISEQRARAVALSAKLETNTRALETLRCSPMGRFFSVLGGHSLQRMPRSKLATPGPGAASTASPCWRRLGGLAACRSRRPVPIKLNSGGGSRVGTTLGFGRS